MADMARLVADENVRCHAQEKAMVQNTWDRPYGSGKCVRIVDAIHVSIDNPETLIRYDRTILAAAGAQFRVGAD